MPLLANMLTGGVTPILSVAELERLGYKIVVCPVESLMVAGSAILRLIDALVTTLTAAVSPATVYDGFGVSEDPGDFLMIGVEDPDLEGAASSADVSQEWANANYTARNESGDVTCAALSWNGDANQKAARDAVYALLAVPCLVITAYYLIGVRRAENRQNIEELERQRDRAK